MCCQEVYSVTQGTQGQRLSGVCCQEVYCVTLGT